MKAPQDILTFDPVALNVVNRVAPGCQLHGALHFAGGLLVQGDLKGDIRVDGRLVVWTEGRVRGQICATGDVFVFGQLGDLAPDAPPTTLESYGMVCIAQTGVSTATLVARRLQLYDGADLRGTFKTLRRGQTLPVLRQVVTDPA
ncbi:MAG: polymer-forming cytoskeletal protein [Burkholderiales bacterium]|nr:polymer-forming cytoskeletal protein [Burkholderiales bacterium]